MKSYVGQKVIIRADRAGVFYGTLMELEGSAARIGNCRRLWYWDGAASLSQLAAEGTTAPENCKFTVTVEDITVLGVIEIIPVTGKAAASIEGAPVWKR